MLVRRHEVREAGGDEGAGEAWGGCYKRSDILEHQEGHGGPCL